MYVAVLETSIYRRRGSAVAPGGNATRSMTRGTANVGPNSAGAASATALAHIGPNFAGNASATSITVRYSSTSNDSARSPAP